MKRKGKPFRRLDPNSKEYDRAVRIMTLLGCDECFRRLEAVWDKKQKKWVEVMRLDGTGPLMAQVWADKYSVCGWRVVCDDCSDRLDKGR